jgi:hypothetical protein
MAAKKKAKLSPEQQAAQKAELLEMNRLASRSLEQTLTETIAKLGEAWNKEQRERAMRVARDLADLYVKQAYGATGVEREIAHAKAAAQKHHRRRVDHGSRRHPGSDLRVARPSQSELPRSTLASRGS